MRYTKAEILGMFNRLVKAMNKKIGREVGDLQLDYASCYGGYVIQELCNDQGGIRHLFGSNRRNAKEMYLSMLMTTIMLEELSYQQRLTEVVEA